MIFFISEGFTKNFLVSNKKISYICVEQNTILVEKMTRIKKSEEEIKAEIIAAGSQLFMKYGYYKTTMEDIARAVKKGKSTLYHYFESKDDVIIGVINSNSIAIVDKIKTGILSLNSAIDMFNEYYRIMIIEVKKAINIFSLLRIDFEENYSFKKKLSKVYHNQDEMLIKMILVYGIKTQEFKHITEENIDDIAGLISLVNRNMVIAFTIEQNRMNWESSIQSLGSIIIRGL